MSEKKSKDEKDIQARMPSAEEVARELGKATSIDDFYPVGCRDGAGKMVSLRGCSPRRSKRCWKRN